MDLETIKTTIEDGLIGTKDIKTLEGWFYQLIAECERLQFKLSRDTTELDRRAQQITNDALRKLQKENAELKKNNEWLKKCEYPMTFHSNSQARMISKLQQGKEIVEYKNKKLQKENAELRKEDKIHNEAHELINSQIKYYQQENEKLKLELAQTKDKLKQAERVIIGFP